MKEKIVASILLNIILLLCLFKLMHTKTYIINEFQRFKINLLCEHKIYDTVMLGDSIISLANWNYLLKNDDVINMGIGGDTTAGVLSRLNQVYKVKPKQVFIMIGINDINGRIELEETIINYNLIINELISNKINPIIVSTLYVSDKYSRYKWTNKRVLKLNKFLIQLAKKNNIAYIDLNAVLRINNKLDNQYTSDGIHLNHEAYLIWINKLMPHFVSK